MRLKSIYTVIFIFLLSSISLAQNKWDLDSVYLAEFGKNSLVNKQFIDSTEVPVFSFKVRPFRPIFGIIDATAELKLISNTSMVLGFHHYSYLYRYGQPNDPSRSYLLNHYGSNIYEEWISANIYSIDFRKFKTKKNKREKQVTTFISFLNRFSFQRWGYSRDNMVDNPYYYDGALQDLYGPSRWMPVNPSNLLSKTVRNYRPGFEYGRRLTSARIIEPEYLKAAYFEYSFCLTLSYDPWNELMYPIVISKYCIAF